MKYKGHIQTILQRMITHESSNSKGINTDQGNFFWKFLSFIIFKRNVGGMPPLRFKTLRNITECPSCHRAMPLAKHMHLLFKDDKACQLKGVHSAFDG